MTRGSPPYPLLGVLGAFLALLAFPSYPAALVTLGALAVYAYRDRSHLVSLQTLSRRVEELEANTADLKSLRETVARLKNRQP